MKADYSVNAIMKLLVYSRILEPASKRRTFDKRVEYFEKFDFSLEAVYRCSSCSRLEENWYVRNYCDEVIVALKDEMEIDLTRKYLQLGGIRKILGTTKK